MWPKNNKSTSQKVYIYRELKLTCVRSCCHSSVSGDLSSDLKEQQQKLLLSVQNVSCEVSMWHVTIRSLWPTTFYILKS